MMGLRMLGVGASGLGRGCGGVELVALVVDLRAQALIPHATPSSLSLAFTVRRSVWILIWSSCTRSCGDLMPFSLHIDLSNLSWAEFV